MRYNFGITARLFLIKIMSFRVNYDGHKLDPICVAWCNKILSILIVI